MADESNDDLDREAEPLWAVRDVDVLLVVFDPYAKRRASTALGRNQNLDRDEALQAARVGLWKAIVRFDPTNGTRFTTFAQRWVDGAIMDAAREADTAPTKLRTAEKKGEVAPLPVMFPLADGFDCKSGTDAVQEAEQNVRELLEQVRGTAVERDVVLWLHCNGNLDDMAASLGVSVEQATILWKSAAEKLRDPQAYMADVASLPVYVPPTEEATVQQTLF
jgi:RNA polymerase sigma factor (sigma-70 family)